MLKKISLDTIIGIALMLAGLYWLTLCAELSADSVTSQYTKPSSYPTALAILLVLLSALLVLRNLFFTKSTQSSGKTAFENMIPVILMIALSGLYVNVVDIFGYIISTVVFLIATMFLFGERKILTMLLVGIIVPVLLYLIFYYLLQVQLP